MDLCTSAELTCTTFLINAALVLEQQIGIVQNDKLYVRPGSQVSSLYQMNAEIDFSV